MELFDGATVLRSKDLEQRGLSRTRIREAMDAGELERIGRGLYAIRGAEPSEHHSLVQVAKRVPHAAICLLSALRFHELTSQNPHEVWIAIGPKDRKPTLDHPSLKVVRYGDERFGSDWKITRWKALVCGSIRSRAPWSIFSATGTKSDWMWRLRRSGKVGSRADSRLPKSTGSQDFAGCAR